MMTCYWRRWGVPSCRRWLGRLLLILLLSGNAMLVVVTARKIPPVSSTATAYEEESSSFTAPLPSNNNNNNNHENANANAPLNLACQGEPLQCSFVLPESSSSLGHQQAQQQFTVCQPSKEDNDKEEEEQQQQCWKVNIHVTATTSAPPQDATGVEKDEAVTTTSPPSTTTADKIPLSNDADSSSNSHSTTAETKVSFASSSLQTTTTTPNGIGTPPNQPHTIGAFTYHPPYRGFGSQVKRLLEQTPAKTHANKNNNNNNNNMNSAFMRTVWAHWYHDIGVALQERLQAELAVAAVDDDDDDEEEDHDMDDALKELAWRAMDAFQVATEQYELSQTLIASTTSDDDEQPQGLEAAHHIDLQSSLLYMKMAVTMQLVSLGGSGGSGTRSTTTSRQQQHQPLPLLQKAEQSLRELYTSLVESETSVSTEFDRKLTLGYAEASLRLGVLQLQDVSSAATSTASSKMGGAGGAGSNGGGTGGATSNTMVTTGGVAALAEQWLLQKIGDENIENLVSNPQEIQDMIEEFIPSIVEQNHGALVLFSRAATLFRRGLQLADRPPTLSGHQKIPSVEEMQHIITAYQNLGNTWLALEQYEPAVEALEESWALAQDYSIKHGLRRRHGSVQVDALIVGMGENLYSLADVYLRMGDYENAWDRYKKSMEWLSQHNVAAALDGKNNPIEGLDESMKSEQFVLIETYEQALEDYHAMFMDGMDSSDPMVADSNGFYARGDADYGSQEFYARDDGYEGDLHNTLGAFYLNVGDVEQAATHLQQALTLYLKAGEGQETTAATTHSQLAMLYFQKGDYHKSAEQYRLAVKIYERIVPEGENPMQHGVGVIMTDWSTLLGQALRQLPAVDAQMPPTLKVDPSLPGLKIMEPKDADATQAIKETEGKKTEDAASSQHSPPQQKEKPDGDPPRRSNLQPVDEEENAENVVMETKKPRKPHKKIKIDMEAFSEAHKNETAMTGEEL